MHASPLLSDVRSGDYRTVVRPFLDSRLCEFQCQALQHVMDLPLSPSSRRFLWNSPWDWKDRATDRSSEVSLFLFACASAEMHLGAIVQVAKHKNIIRSTGVQREAANCCEQQLRCCAPWKQAVANVGDQKPTSAQQSPAATLGRYMVCLLPACLSWVLSKTDSWES